MHYWADLQSVHGFRCYDNTAIQREMSASASTRSVPGLIILTVRQADRQADSQTPVLRFVMGVAPAKNGPMKNFLVDETLTGFDRKNSPALILTTSLKLGMRKQRRT